MKNRFFSIILSLILIVSFIPTALATSDTNPPVLISCVPTKATFNSGENVEYTLKVSDDNGIDETFTCIYLEDADTNRYFRVIMKIVNDISTPEESAKGIYTYTLSLPVNDNFYTADYEVNSILLKDNVGNGVFLNQTNYKIDNIHVENTVRTDFTGPVIDSVEIDKTNVSVGDTINFKIKVSDPSGVTGGYSIYYYGETPVYDNIQLNRVSEDDSVWQGSLTINQYLKQGTYYLSAILFDKLGNSATRGISSFYVSNPDSAGEPFVEKIEFSKSTVKTGDKVTIKATIDSNGTAIEDSIGISFYYGDSSGMEGTNLKRDETGIFTGDWAVPVNAQTCTFKARIIIDEKNTTLKQYFGECGSYVFPTLNIQSVFTGLENKSVLAGASFDPMADVSASNESQGDMTNRIEVTGNVNTNQPGLYLLHYKINSGETINYNNNVTPIYYLESRWIGVTEIMPPGAQSSDSPLALTDDSLKIGTDFSSVSVKLNGEKISNADLYTKPGVYSVSENAQDSSSGAAALSVDTANSVNAVIDKSGPVISAAWQKDSSGNIAVNVKTSDDSGIAVLRYMAGDCSKDECKNNGTDFTNSFTVSDYGNYTLYSSDGLGNESVKTFDIEKNTINSARLLDPGISGGSVSPAFSDTNYSYNVELGENDENITFAPLAENSNAQTFINGISTEKSSSQTYSIKNGRNKTVNITVKCSGHTHMYKFFVKRDRSTDNYLKSITIYNYGDLSPSFSPDVTSYKLDIDENTKFITILSAADAPGLATINHSEVIVNLKNNETKDVKIKVKPQLGAVKIYEISVHRDACTNADLSYIKTSPSNVLNTAYKNDTTDYTITLPASKKSVTISTKAAGYGAKITINGSMCKSKNITVAKGASIPVTIEVIAQDGTEKDYHITITRLTQ